MLGANPSDVGKHDTEAMLDGLRGTPREHGVLGRGQRDDEHLWIQIAQGS